MEENQTPSTPTQQTATPAQSVMVAHDSNPFTTAFAGIKKLLVINPTALGLITLSSTVVYVLMGLIGMTMLVGLFALAAIYIPDVLATYNPSSYAQLTELTGDLNEPSIYVLLVGGLVLLLVLSALLQSLQIKLATATSLTGRIGFVSLLKQSLIRIPVLLAVEAISVLVIITIVMICIGLAWVAQPMIFLLFLLVPVLIIAGIYIGLRLAFTAFAVIAEHAGPLAAFRRSWELTRKHTIEVLGVVAASAIMIGLPVGILDALVSTISGPVGGFLTLIVALIGIAASVLALMPLSERFCQLRAIKNGQIPATKIHILNYLSIIFLFVVGLVANTLLPDPTAPNQDYYNMPEYRQENNEVDSNYQLN